MPREFSVTYAKNGQSKLIIWQRSDSLFMFGIDYILDGNQDIPEAIGCWKSAVSGVEPSGLYATEREAFRDGCDRLGWDPSVGPG